jgi:hypothetical protein
MLHYAAAGCGFLRHATSFEDRATSTVDLVVYDARERIVLYRERCCASDAAILVAGVSRPPVGIRSADLRGIRTGRGAVPGMSVGEVMQRYGHARTHAMPGKPGITLLSYATLTPKAWNSSAGAACAQFQNFAFRDGRLFEIELIGGC